MRVDAIQPFVYLSNNAGPTGNWFLGDIASLVPKPLLATLKNAFAPFGVSVEMWDRHFRTGEMRSLRLFVFNDDPVERTGTLRYGIVRGGDVWVHEVRERVSVPPSGCSVIPVQVKFPAGPGACELVAEVSGAEGPCSVSRKIAHVSGEVVEEGARGLRCLISDSRGEVTGFLARHGLVTGDIGGEAPAGYGLIVVGEGMLRDPEYIRNIPAISGSVRNGASLVVLEPEFGNREKETVTIIEGVSLTIERRTDTDKGGYDSYVFPSDVSHPLWRNIDPGHLKMFNGGYGGEMVSQHTVIGGVPMEALASCGLNLAHPAVMFARAGAGCIVVSRIQTRGRLAPGGEPDHLFARREDPVAEQYMLNLVTAFRPGGGAA